MKNLVDRDKVILLLLFGLTFHDFGAISSLKIGFVTITCLRVILAVTIPALLIPRCRFQGRDLIGTMIFVFLVYGLCRIGDNFRQAFPLYCTMLAFYFLYISIENEQQLKNSTKLLAVILIFFCLVGIYEILSGVHFGQNHLEGMTETNDRLAFGMYFNENDFSAFLAVLVFYILLSDLQKGTKVVFLIAAISIMAVNKSASCLLALITYVPVVYLLRTRKNRFLRMVVTIMGVLIMMVPTAAMIKNSSIGTRSYMYGYSIKNCLAHLWFGTGIGNYARGMKEVGFEETYSVSADPHNLFFELAGQFGMIWAILLLALIIRLLVFFARRLGTKEGLCCFGLIYIIPFVGLSSSTCMEKNYIYLALLIPLIYYRIDSYESEKIRNDSMGMYGLQQYFGWMVSKNSSHEQNVPAFHE